MAYNLQAILSFIFSKKKIDGSYETTSKCRLLPVFARLLEVNELTRLDYGLHT